MILRMLSVLRTLNFVTPCASAQNVLQLKRFAFASVGEGGERGSVPLFPLEEVVSFPAGPFPRGW